MVITTAGIAVGDTATNAIQLNEATALGITTASYITATTLTFLVSLDGTNFYSLYDDRSTEVSLTVAASAVRAYRLDVASMVPWNWLKIREGTSASPVAQQNRDITFNISNTIL